MSLKSVAVLIGAVLSASTLLGACSAGADASASEAAIAAFHQALNDGRFDAIYAGSAQDMKSATPQAELTQLLAAVHRKLGAFKSGKTVGWNDNINTAGHFMGLTVAATYERGAAQESFTYRVNGKQALLAGYHINSTALILN